MCMNDHIYTHCYSFNFSLFLLSLFQSYMHKVVTPCNLLAETGHWSDKFQVFFFVIKILFFFLGLAKSTCKSKISRLVDGLSSKGVVFLVNWILGVEVVEEWTENRWRTRSRLVVCLEFHSLTDQDGSNSLFVHRASSLDILLTASVR